MPRTTPKQQFERYQFIKRAFLEHRSVFADLIAMDQWELFDFYKPRSDFTLEQLRAYQAEMSKQQPSLPQRAGKAYREFERAYENWVARAAQPQVPVVKDRRNSRTKPHNYVIRGLARDDIDMTKLARALLDMAKSMSEEDRAA